jgi:hypothetical protein
MEFTLVNKSSDGLMERERINKKGSDRQDDSMEGNRMSQSQIKGRLRVKKVKGGPY